MPFHKAYQSEFSVVSEAVRFFSAFEITLVYSNHRGATESDGGFGPCSLLLMQATPDRQALT